MSTTRIRTRLALVAALATAAIGSASPAYAGSTPVDCDVRLERLEAQFYDMADRRGYEVASEWWEARWQAYFQSCVMH